MKKLYILLIVFGMLSCEKDTKPFKPTTRLENVLKNKKLSKRYYDFRTDNIILSLNMDTTKIFKIFVAEATIKELINLTECEQPFVRCVAFRALIEKKYPDIKKILFRHKYDKELVQEFHGSCIRMSTPVNYYMLNKLRPFASYKNKEFLELEKKFMEE